MDTPTTATPAYCLPLNRGTRAHLNQYAFFTLLFFCCPWEAVGTSKPATTRGLPVCPVAQHYYNRARLQSPPKWLLTSAVLSVLKHARKPPPSAGYFLGAHQVMHASAASPPGCQVSGGAIAATFSSACLVRASLVSCSGMGRRMAKHGEPQMTSHVRTMPCELQRRSRMQACPTDNTTTTADGEWQMGGTTLPASSAPATQRS